MTTRHLMTAAVALALAMGAAAAADAQEGGPRFGRDHDRPEGHEMMRHHGGMQGEHGRMRHHGGPGGPGDHGMMMLDADGDGQVSQDEFTDPAAARFAAADSDGNGELTAEEMKAYEERMREARRDAMIARRIERMDADGNGTLSLEEMKAPAGRMARFEALDTDGDGSLSADELSGPRRMQPDGAGPVEAPDE